jgi:DNA-binding transcriptional MerR regulator
MANDLTRAFLAATEQRAGQRAPASVRDASARFGWSTHDLAERLGVSERTARRYKQQDRIPPRKAAEYRREAEQAAQDKMRDRITSRGLSGMRVQGRYQISKSVYETHPDAPVRLLEDSHISGATMREFYDALAEGDEAAAEEILAGALGEGYGVGEGMSWERVDELDYRIR